MFHDSDEYKDNQVMSGFQNETFPKSFCISKIERAIKISITASMLSQKVTNYCGNRLSLIISEILFNSVQNRTPCTYRHAKQTIFGITYLYTCSCNSELGCHSCQNNSFRNLILNNSLYTFNLASQEIIFWYIPIFCIMVEVLGSNKNM